MSLINPSFMF